MRFDRPEVWTLAAVFAIASLILAFGHIGEEMLEGDATKFDERILLFFRNANDLSDPIGPPWVEEMARIGRDIKSGEVSVVGWHATLSSARNSGSSNHSGRSSPAKPMQWLGFRRRQPLTASFTSRERERGASLAKSGGNVGLREDRQGDWAFGGKGRWLSVSG